MKLEAKKLKEKRVLSTMKDEMAELDTCEGVFQVDIKKFKDEMAQTNQVYENFVLALNKLKSVVETGNVKSTISIKIGEGECNGKIFDIILAVNQKKEDE